MRISGYSSQVQWMTHCQRISQREAISTLYSCLDPLVTGCTAGMETNMYDLIITASQLHSIGRERVGVGAPSSHI